MRGLWDGVGVNHDISAPEAIIEIPAIEVKSSSRKKKKRSPTQQSKQPISYVFKHGPNASPMNRKVHAIAEEEPSYGRWYGKALCDERPKEGAWGWEKCDRSELSCPKCYQMLEELVD